MTTIQIGDIVEYNHPTINNVCGIVTVIGEYIDKNNKSREIRYFVDWFDGYKGAGAEKYGFSASMLKRVSQ